jgi:hypothetical protein
MWVGEGGKELFIPSEPGVVVPHSKSERLESESLFGMRGTPVQTGGDGVSLLGVLEHIASLLSRQRLTVTGGDLALLVNQANERNGGR